MGMTMMGWAVNKQWLENMPENDRKALVRSVDIASHSNRKAILDQIGDLTQSYSKSGMTVTFLSPNQPEFQKWKAATAPPLKKTLAELNPDVPGLFTAQENTG